MALLQLLATLCCLAGVLYIGRKLNAMLTKADLDKALDGAEGDIETTIHTAIAAESADIVKAIQDKVPPTEVDLTDEIARIQNLASLVAPKVAADVAATLNPPPSSTTASP